MNAQPDLFGNEVREAQNEAAELIREHLWLNRTPPKPHPSAAPWTMARDLDIWKKLVAAGWKPYDINRAITTVRELLSSGNRDRAITMRVFWFKDGSTPLLERAVGEAFKREYRDGPRKNVLPPTVRDILLKMAQP